MLRLSKYRVAASVMLMTVVACETSFNPKGEYTEQLIVYSILSTRSDIQFVRVYTTYNPSGFDPYEHTSDTPIRDAQIEISTGSTKYQFRDTTIERYDTSRYGANLPAYVASPFVVGRGKSYTLTVKVPSRRTVTSTVGVPDPAFISVSNPFVLKDPAKFDEDIFVNMRISAITRGFIMRLLLDYKYRSNGKWISGRAEVPSAVQTSDGNASGFVYPRLTRRSSAAVGEGTETVSFSNFAYRSLLQDLLSEHTGTELKITGAVFILTQVENNLYNYFNIVNGFQDEFSIRTDQPDFSGFKGALGVFGAMADDSVAFDLTLQF